MMTVPEIETILQLFGLQTGTPVYEWVVGLSVAFVAVFAWWRNRKAKDGTRDTSDGEQSSSDKPRKRRKR